MELLILGIVLVLVLVLAAYFYFANDKDESEPEPETDNEPESEQEHMNLPSSNVDKARLKSRGYTDVQPWDATLAETQLDPSAHSSHQEFVRSTKRFSSGANFTNVSDDDSNPVFTNFVGLRRPTHVPIGASARTRPDVDEDVLKRNKRFSWTNGPDFSD